MGVAQKGKLEPLCHQVCSQYLDTLKNTQQKMSDLRYNDMAGNGGGTKKCAKNSLSPSFISTSTYPTKYAAKYSVFFNNDIAPQECIYTLYFN